MRGSLDLNKSDLKEGPSFSERMQAKAREEMRLSERSRHLSQADIRDSGVAKRRPALMATISSLIGWAIIGSVIAVDYLVFRLLFDVNYFSWYLENGAVINIVFSVISLAVVLDAYTGLISSNPFRYLWACMALTDHVSLAAFAFNPDEDAPGGTAAARREREQTRWRPRQTTPRGSTPRPPPAGRLQLGQGGNCNSRNDADGTADGTWWLPMLFDSVISLLVSIAMFAATFGWLLIVAPVQYLAFAVLGAPARNALRGKIVATYDPVTDTTMDVPVGTAHRGFEIGYREKPVSLTAALAAAVFWVISAL